MPIRERNGKWHYRFTVHRHEYSGSTDLPATERNRTAAMRKEAEARQLVLAGRAQELRLEMKPFSEAATAFLAWATTEHRQHPATARRLATSFASLRRFFGRRSVSSITVGDVEDYKAWRRSSGIREVTVRHDLHALSPFFGYAIKHNWTRQNPVREVEIPSDADAVRIHVLTDEEERLYFDTCRLGFEVTLENGRKVKHGPYLDLHDVGRLMLNQGMRPEEVESLPWTAVDLAGDRVSIGKGKSKAARRSLRLTPESRAILDARKAFQTGEILGKWVFPSPRKPGRHITKLNNSHTEVLRHTGLSFVIYDLRHTFATRMAERGMDLATLAKILGHANLRSVMKYVHPSQKHMDEAMERYGTQEIAHAVSAQTEAIQ